MSCLSFVIPCYGSESTISFVIEEIQNILAERPQYDYEIIAVNDCSPDHVWDILQELADKNHRIRLIGLAKNMNRPGAVMAGLRNSSGDYIVIMDDDGQCPMNRFWDLLEPIEGEYDVSTAGYPTRKQSAFKDFGTFVNKKMTEFILDRPKEIQFTNFMVMRRFVVDEICKYQNPYPYLTGLILRTTCKIICVPMEERSRYSGKSGFTFVKMLNLWMNGFTAFSIKPLRIATAAGAVCAFLGFACGLWVAIQKLLHPEILAGYSSVMAMMLFIGGMIMLMLGMIGEYIGRIYISINNSPQYVIRETKNIQEFTRKEN